MKKVFLIACIFGVCLHPAYAAEFTLTQPTKPKIEYSPNINKSFPQRVYWGDTHLHTTYSPDAGIIGNFNLGPADAYEFAKGKQVTANNGMQVKLSRPLDFLVVSDHSEYQGLMPELRGGNPEILKNETGRRWYNWFKGGPEEKYKVFLEFAEDLSANKGRIPFKKVARSTWDLMTETADNYNDPGKFTAFIGYEWTSTPKGNNLHRVVIFKDDAEKAGRVAPFSSFDSADPEDLWSYMANYEKETGGRVMSIPHNANVSNGWMYDTKKLNGKPFDTAYAELRARFEPLHEVTQMKGDSETHPKLSPNDPFADYETWDKSNLTGEAAPNESDLPGSYARSALKRGMELKTKLGTNPYKQGFIGSTDSHTSLATAEEDNYWGKASMIEPEANRYKHVLIKSQVDDNLTTYGYETTAAGLAAVWAKENTREALFESMERRETYATTGPRITVRVFAGWDFVADDIHRQDFAEHGYSNGVPMGGDLKGGKDGKAPILLIRTLRDPDGANLDRIQVVKGWIDSQDKSHERVFDVVCSNNRKVADLRCDKDVGNTVNIAKATYTNTIGEPYLFGHWTDPEFDPKQEAFYYVRVIEIPTPRWPAYDALRFKVKMPDNVVMEHQERAYTSPIWYTP